MHNPKLVCLNLLWSLYTPPMKPQAGCKVTIVIFLFLVIAVLITYLFGQEG